MTLRLMSKLGSAKIKQRAPYFVPIRIAKVCKLDQAKDWWASSPIVLI